jgi:hypothetical protein
LHLASKRGRGIRADYRSKVFVEVLRHRALIRREELFWTRKAPLTKDTRPESFGATQRSVVRGGLRRCKEIWQRDDPAMLPSVINTLLHGQRALNRAAAAYALNLMHGKAAIPALERVVANKREHPRVRGQAAESLAHNHRPESHRILRESLNDASKEVRFWCAYSLAEMADEEALIPLKKLAQDDQRVVRGSWSVSRAAKAAIRTIRRKMGERGRQRRPCLFCSKMRAKADSRKSRA